MSTLGSRWAKAARAQDHLEQLDTEVKAFLGSHPYSIIEEIDPKHRGANDKPMTLHTFRGFLHRDRPDWGPLIGDILNNLRSALDHLAWHLAGDAAYSKTEFPIFVSKEVYESRAPDKMKGFADDAVTSIKGMQPWSQRPDDPEDHPLWKLHRLANDDKHQRLHITQAAIGIEFDPRTVRGRGDIARLLINQRFLSRSFHHGAIVAQFAAVATDDGPVPKVEMNPQPTYLITFDPEGPARGAPILETLWEFWGRVIAILAQFDSEPRPPGY